MAGVAARVGGVAVGHGLVEPEAVELCCVGAGVVDALCAEPGEDADFVAGAGVAGCPVGAVANLDIEAIAALMTILGAGAGWDDFILALGGGARGGDAALAGAGGGGGPCRAVAFLDIETVAAQVALLCGCASGRQRCVAAGVGILLGAC